MPSVLHSSSQLLKALPSADFELLRPHLDIGELVREAVPVEAGAPLSQEILAQMIRVQRNAVLIVAHALQQPGIIRCSRRIDDPGIRPITLM